MLYGLTVKALMSNCTHVLAQAGPAAGRLAEIAAVGLAGTALAQTPCWLSMAMVWLDFRDTREPPFLHRTAQWVYQGIESFMLEAFVGFHRCTMNSTTHTTSSRGGGGA